MMRRGVGSARSKRFSPGSFPFKMLWPVRQPIITRICLCWLKKRYTAALQKYVDRRRISAAISKRPFFFLHDIASFCLF
jgi:hypothetical protein